MDVGEGVVVGGRVVVCGGAEAELCLNILGKELGSG